MKKICIAVLMMMLSLTSCSNKQTLQKYFVENTDNANFVALDISPSIVNVDKTKLTLEQSEALNSFKKMNVLAFKLNDTNKASYEIEKTKVKEILKDKKYQQLMKFGSGKNSASVSFVGDEDHIEEFILFANQSESGFAVVRILGNDMNPNGIMTMLSVLQASNVDFAQLQPLQEMIK
jgi:hypothetical protein